MPADDKPQDYDMEGARPLNEMSEEDLQALNQKIIDARKDMDKKSGKPNPSHEHQSGSNDQTSQGMRIASEIIASPVAGGILGYLIDSLFGTHPAALIIMIVLGIVAGFYRAYKLSQ